MRESMSVLVTKLVVFALLALLGIFVLIFLFLGLSSWLNQLLESEFLGYFLVAAFFAVALFLVLISREKIMARVGEQMNAAAKEEKSDSDV